MVGLVHLLLCDHLLSVEVESQLQLVGHGTHFIIAVNPFLDGLHLLHLSLGPLWVVPEVGSLCPQVFFLPLYLFLVYTQIAAQLFGALGHVFQLVLCNHGAKVRISERNAKENTIFLFISLFNTPSDIP